MAFNGSAPMNKRPRVDVRNDMDGSHKIKSELNHGDDPRRKRPENPENCVLLYTIYNAVYPITTEVIHTISSPSGNVLRIVIFKKTGVQAMVEFDSIESAKRAKEALNGADIYSGCCTLKIEYAKPTKLNVRKNDTESWDYTLNSGSPLGHRKTVHTVMESIISSKDFWLGCRRAPNVLEVETASVRCQSIARTTPSSAGKVDNVSTRPPPLLEEPRFGAGPQPYRSESGRNLTGGSYGTAERYDFHGGGGGAGGGGGGGGGEYVDHYGSDRFSGGHPERMGFKREFGRDPVSSPMTNRNPTGFRGNAALPTPGNLGVTTGTGPVMMVYGLDTKKLNCDRLFNLFCLYGNVARIKFLKTKEGAAMIQMGDGSAVERCVQHLNNAPMFNSKNRLQLGYSKQLFLSDVTNPFSLPDGSPSFKDFIGNKHNRFVSLAMSMKNRIQSPSRILHFFNTPPNIAEDTLLGLFEERKISPPTAIKIFPMKSERSSSGLLEFDDVEKAVETLVVLNHAPIENPTGKFPYTMKLCFSSTRQVNVNGSGRHQSDGNEMNDN